MHASKKSVAPQASSAPMWMRMRVSMRMHLMQPMFTWGHIDFHFSLCTLVHIDEGVTPHMATKAI